MVSKNLLAVYPDWSGALTWAFPVFQTIMAVTGIFAGRIFVKIGPHNVAIADAFEGARATAKAAGVPVLVGQHRRHNPFVKKAKQIIESGALGKLTVSSFHYMIYKNDEYFDVEWRRKKGAGPILVNLVHDIDLLRYLLGEPVAIQGM